MVLILGTFLIIIVIIASSGSNSLEIQPPRSAGLDARSSKKLRSSGSHLGRGLGFGWWRIYDKGFWGQKRLRNGLGMEIRASILRFTCVVDSAEISESDVSIFLGLLIAVRRTMLACVLGALNGL